jgi:hypothetical protein
MIGDDLEIACPKCDWHPDGGKYWQCDCGHSWDTFTTAARCPKCNKQHKLTACMPPFMGGCSQLSPHLDWYKNLDELLREELEHVLEEVKVETL